MLSRITKYSIFILVLILFLLIGSGRIESSDGVSALSVTRNIIQTGRFNMPPPVYTNGLQTTRGKGGLYYSPTSLGMSLAYLPAALISRAVYLAQGNDFPQYYPLQSDFITEFFASFTNPILAFFLFVVNYLIFSLFIKNRGQAFFLSFIISFATILLPLSKDAFSHILFTLLIMSSVYQMLVYMYKDKKISRLIYSGIFAGMAVLSYNMVFVIVLGILFVAFVVMFQRKKYTIPEIIQKVLIWSIAISPFLLIFFYYNFVRFGSYFSTGYDLHSFDLTTKAIFFEGLWGLLFSSGKSIFLYSPILVPAVVIALQHLKKDWSSQLFLVMTAVLIGFYSLFVFWSGELSWGPRYLSLIVPFAGIVLARNWKDIWNKKIILTLLIMVGIFVQLEGTVINYEKQYQIFDYPMLVLPNKMSRVQLFAYWRIGQFIPQYSPIYSQKKEVIKNILEIPSILKPKGLIHFAKNTGLPKKDLNGVYYRPAKTLMYLYTKKDLKFNTISIGAKKLPYKIDTVLICTTYSCIHTEKADNTNGSIHITFDTPVSIQKNSYLLIKLISPKFVNYPLDFSLYSFAIGNDEVSMKDYSLANLDSFLVRGTILAPHGFDINNFNEANFFRNEVVTNTPDFWWIKSAVYFNESASISLFFYILLAGVAFSVLGILADLKK